MRTDMLERMVEAATALPPELQDDIARVVLDCLGDDLPPVRLTPEDEAAIRRSREETDRGEYMSDEQMRSIWAKYDL